jgi:carbamoyl-phosphate synthase large subunit
LVVNTTRGAKEIRDSYSIRRHALLTGIPYFTTMSAALAGIDSLEADENDSAQVPERVRTLQQWAALSAD